MKDPIERKTRRRISVSRVEYCAHLIYFALVAISGPYHIAAGLLFCFGVIVLTFHLEE